MRTVGIDLATQPRFTGVVVIDWSSAIPVVERASRHWPDEALVDLILSTAAIGGKVGIDCPLGWPRGFVAYVAAHAAGELPLPGTTDTRRLQRRATDFAVRERTSITALAVATDRIGATAIRAARLLAALRDDGIAVNRAGTGVICEVYPRASRAVWGLPPKERNVDAVLAPLRLSASNELRTQLGNEHVFDALIASLTARAAALGMTEPPDAEQAELAREEGWIHLPTTEHARISRLVIG